MIVLTEPNCRYCSCIVVKMTYTSHLSDETTTTRQSTVQLQIDISSFFFFVFFPEMYH